MKRYRIILTASERKDLKVLIASGKYKNTKQKRAQILLAADESEGGKKMKDSHIAKAYDVREKMVERTRKRFVEHGYDLALHGEKRSKKGPTLDSRISTKLIALRCSEAPCGYTKWTLRLLADKMVELDYVETISHESVRQI